MEHPHRLDSLPKHRSFLLSRWYNGGGTKTSHKKGPSMNPMYNDGSKATTLFDGPTPKPVFKPILTPETRHAMMLLATTIRKPLRPQPRLRTEYSAVIIAANINRKPMYFRGFSHASGNTDKTRATPTWTPYPHMALQVTSLSAYGCFVYQVSCYGAWNYGICASSSGGTRASGQGGD